MSVLAFHLQSLTHPFLSLSWLPHVLRLSEFSSRSCFVFVCDLSYVISFQPHFLPSVTGARVAKLTSNPTVSVYQLQNPCNPQPYLQSLTASILSHSVCSNPCLSPTHHDSPPPSHLSPPPHLSPAPIALGSRVPNPLFFPLLSSQPHSHARVHLFSAGSIY